MKFFKKSALVFSMLLIVTFISPFNAFADNSSKCPDRSKMTILDATNSTQVEIHESTKVNPIKVFVERYCDNSPTGRHEAYARGWGILYRGSERNSTLVFNDGCAWQCPYCYETIVTENDYLPDGNPIGYYATWNPGYETAAYGTVLYSNNIFYSSGSTIRGINFRYTPYGGKY